MHAIRTNLSVHGTFRVKPAVGNGVKLKNWQSNSWSNESIVVYRLPMLILSLNGVSRALAEDDDSAKRT